jgi:rare lipoprotein A
MLFSAVAEVADLIPCGWRSYISIIHEDTSANTVQRNHIHVVCVVLVLNTLSGCTLVGVGSPSPPLTSGDGINFDEIPDAIPQAEFKSRSGNPETYVIEGVTYRVMDTSDDYHEEGIASWYGGYFHGRRTSSGDVYDMYLMTAAHKSLPLPTYVRVTNLDNGRSVVLRVNDRGPFVDDRIIDLSFAAATKLGMADQGTAEVEVVALDPPARERTP